MVLSFTIVLISGLSALPRQGYPPKRLACGRAVEAIRLQDRVIEKSIRRPPVERFGPPVPFFSSNCFL